MRTVIVGLGVQGRKRLAALGPDAVEATVDPRVPDAGYASLRDVPLEAFEAAFVCVPDGDKVAVVRYLLGHGKHVLVEKPLLSADDAELRDLAETARVTRTACYTAYNHRFEPHVVRLKQVLAAGTLGRVYLARLFYGNGTAVNVRASPWRDRGLGVLSDLGSHLLDLVLFLFGTNVGTFRAWCLRRFENRAWDHVVFGTDGPPTLILESSLVCWRNTFGVDLFGELGSAHVDGLCKWGVSRFIWRRRTLPSGRPVEECTLLEGPDPTWRAEHEHFGRLCAVAATNLDNDVWINGALRAVAGTPGLDGRG